MDFDDLLVNHVGEIGLYQMLILLFGCSVTINNAFNSIDYTFIGATPKFRCDFGPVPEPLNNLSFDELLMLTSPKTEGGQVDACWIKDYNYSSLTAEVASQLVVGQNNNNNNRSEQLMKDDINITWSRLKCDRWVYSQEEFTQTIVTQWDLVCDRRWLVATSQSVYMAGQFTIFIGGFLADRYGRRPVTLACICFNIALRCLLAFTPNFYVFLLARFLLSCVAMTLYVSIFLLALECVGPSWRVLAGQLPYVFWSVGYMILSCMAYLIRDWSQLTLILMAFSLPYLLHFCLLKESVRWYNSKNRTAEALELVQRMAKVNRREIPDKVLSQLKADKDRDPDEAPKAKVTDLLKSWVTIKLTLYLCVIWFCTNCVYYGLIFYLPELGGNIYISTFISGALELPALAYVQLTLNTRLGRRLNTFLTLALAGVVLLALIWIPKDYTWLSISLALTGRFAIAATYSVIYIHTSELYPTVLRTTGLSACNVVCRISSILAPQMATVGVYALYLPPLLFGGMSIVAAVLSLLLPETRGAVLRDTVTIDPIKPRYCDKDEKYIGESITANTYM